MVPTPPSDRARRRRIMSLPTLIYPNDARPALRKWVEPQWRRCRMGQTEFWLMVSWLVVGCSTPERETPSLASARSRTEATSEQPAVSAEAKATEKSLSAAPSAVERVPPPPKPAKPRVYAKSRFVWIREHPNADMQWIGFLWTGGSVALKSETPQNGPGCQTWYAIEPHGYVCVDGKRATLDPDDPAFKALEPFAPNLDSAWPHAYGESRGLKRYVRLPPLEHAEDGAPSTVAKAVTTAEQTSTPPFQPVKQLEHDPFGLVELAGPVHEGRTRLLPLSTVAYSAELERRDGTYLLAADMTWVPKNRVTPYQKVIFKGVELGKEGNLPLAFFRGKDRPQYVEKSEGHFEENGKVFERLSHVELTGRSVSEADDVYLEVKGLPVYVKESDGVVPKPQERTPWGTKVGSTDTKGHPEQGRATWLEASVWGGWLLAYEGNRPVYATMISPGRGGTPVPGKDPLETASTPTGSFPISGKFATATMEAPGEFIHSDVPWTQNFSGPHALHGAYWHNDWGKLKSGGCVNVSPRDGRWLFNFTEPAVPEGWHGVRWLPYEGPATIFVVHR